MKKAMMFLIIMLMQACTTVSSVDRPIEYAPPPGIEQDSIIGESALGADDQQIARLLNHSIKLPKRNRVAILKLGGEQSWRGYSAELTDLNDSLVEKFVSELRGSERVFDASFLPGLLVADKITVSLLRESAARFQADLLLAYTSRCRSYRKYRVLAADKARSYCAIEAILLDVRSGIVAKSVVSTEAVKVLETNDDINLSETIRKSELEAVSVALGRVAAEVVTYLHKVPAL